MIENTMKIKSKIGDVIIEKDKILKFEKGLLAFKNDKKFVLLNIEKDSPFKLLQSLDHPDIGFIVANPLVFKFDYEVIIKRADIEELEIEDPKSALVLVIITIPKRTEDISANLKGPIVINEKNHLAKQIIIDSDDYQIKYSIGSRSKEYAFG